MPALVRYTGQVETAALFSRPNAAGRVALTTSTGGVIVVIADSNDAAASVGYGDRTDVSKIYIYESTDRSTFTLRQTITMATALSDPNLWTAELMSDNSIAITYRLSNKNIGYRRVTYGTWSVGAEEIVVTAVANSSYVALDIDTSDADVPFIIAWRTLNVNPRGRIELYVRRTSSGTWVLSTYIDVVLTPTPDLYNADVSMSVLQGGTATQRNIIFAAAYGTTTTDYGTRIFTVCINESSAAAGLGGQAITGRLFVGTGEVTPGHGHTNPVRRVSLWKCATNQAVFATMSFFSADKTGPAKYVGKYSWDGTTWSVPVTASRNVSGSIIHPRMGMAMTYGNDGVSFYFVHDVDSNGFGEIEVSHSKIVGSGVRFSGEYMADNNALSSYWVYNPIGNGQKFAYQFKTHDMVFYRQVSSTGYMLYHNYLYTPPQPYGLTPAASSVVTTGVPAISADVRLGRKWPQYPVKIMWQFAKDLLFTTQLREYEQDDVKYTTVNNTDGATSYVRVNDVLPELYAMASGNWYVRACLLDFYEQVGPWTTARLFAISHPASAINRTPDDGKYVPFATYMQLSWGFSDPYPSDYQSAYQAIVERDTDGVVILDTGKTPSAAKSVTVSIPATYKDTRLRWKVQVWDADDVTKGYIQYAYFYTADPVPITISTPANGSVVTTNAPTITLTGTMPAPRTVASYRVNIKQAGVLIWSSGSVRAADQVGAFSIIVKPTVALVNTQAYSIEATITDSAGISSPLATSAITTLWAAPAVPTGLSVDTSQYNVENQGYVAVSWTNSAQDVDLVYWNVYRKVDEIDPYSLVVLSAGTWKPIGQVFDSLTNYEFRDYYSPAAHGVSYKVTQTVNRFGDLIESLDSAVITVYPASDGYWFIEPETFTTAPTAFKLSIVSGDSYTGEFEEEEYTIVGRGRHIDQGDELGLKGTLEVQLRNSAASSARMKKMRLETMKRSSVIFSMRTPFGDVYRVHAGNMSVTRIAGVGQAEFVDVSIPYSEVF